MVYYIIKYKSLEYTMTILYTFFSLIIILVYISNMLIGNLSLLILTQFVKNERSRLDIFLFSSLIFIFFLIYFPLFYF